MIPPILGESFVKSASLDNGRNGLASIGPTTIDTSAGISSALGQTYEAMRKAPENVQKNLDDGFQNLLGSQATETVYEYNADGSIKSKKEVPIADSWNADGLLGKHYQREAVSTATEQKRLLLNQQMQETDKQAQAIANEFKTENDVLRAMKQSITDKADAELHSAFGNIGTFDDTKKVFENYFLKVGNLDMTMAVDSWRTGGKNSQIYNELVGSKKMSENDFNRLMSYANKVVNIDTDKTNALNGELDYNNTKRLYESTRAILGQNGYNDVQSAYLADTGIKLGVTNIEHSKKGLEMATFNNRLQKGKLQSQAIAIQNMMDEQKRFNDAQIKLGKERNSLLKEQIKNNQQQQEEEVIQQNNDDIKSYEAHQWGLQATNENGEKMSVIEVGGKPLYLKESDIIRDENNNVKDIKEGANIIQLADNAMRSKDLQNTTKELLNKRHFYAKNGNTDKIKEIDAQLEALHYNTDFSSRDNSPILGNIMDGFATIDSAVSNAFYHIGIPKADRVTTVADAVFGNDENVLAQATHFNNNHTAVGQNYLKKGKPITRDEVLGLQSKSQQQTQQQTQQQNIMNQANNYLKTANGDIQLAIALAQENKDAKAHSMLNMLSITPTDLKKSNSKGNELIGNILTNGDSAVKMLKDNKDIYQKADTDNFSYSKINEDNLNLAAALSYMLSKQNSSLSKSQDEMSRFVTAVYGILNADSDSEAVKIHGKYVEKNGSPLTTYLNINTPISIRDFRNKFKNKNMSFNEYMQQIMQMNLIKG